jgi:exopolyphosphatase/guanosine-5'-triphosphate,3'-diphosphate pyrophosphatase
MIIDQKKKVYAGIDIGSNTIRLIIGYFKDEKLHTIKKFLKITRLGRGFHKTGRISDEQKRLSVVVLSEYSDIITRYNAKKISACATGVLRSAENSKEFVDDVFNHTRLSVNIISGEKEALLTTIGVKSVIEADPPRSLIFDIGGGSAEFILSINDTTPIARSIDIGAITLFESFIKSDPPRNDELRSMNEHVKEELNKFIENYFAKKIPSYLNDGFSLVFTAGTATTLAAMKLKMEEYDPDMINNHKMTYDEIRSIYDELITKSKKEREKITGLEKGREDIIISGTAVALNVMELFSKDKVIISDAGLLEGIVIDCYKNSEDEKIGA